MKAIPYQDRLQRAEAFEQALVRRRAAQAEVTPPSDNAPATEAQPQTPPAYFTGDWAGEIHLGTD